MIDKACIALILTKLMIDKACIALILTKLISQCSELGGSLNHHKYRTK